MVYIEPFSTQIPRSIVGPTHLQVDFTLATTLKGKSQTRLVLSMAYCVLCQYTIDTVHNIFLYIQTLHKYNGNVQSTDITVY